MANKFRSIPEPEETKQEEITKTSQPAQKKKASGVVNSLNILFSGTFLSNESVLKHIPFVFFLFAMGIIYIANGYWADDKLRQVNKISGQLKELRSEFISTKSELMFISKQSEVAKSAERIGLKEPITPPMKISIDSTGK